MATNEIGFVSPERGYESRCWTLAVGQYSMGKDVCFLRITQGKRVAS